MNKILKYLQLSPLYPLKGTIVTNEDKTKLVVNAPLRGLGVNGNKIINPSHNLSQRHD